MNRNTSQIAASLSVVKADIRRFEEKHGRTPGSVQLLAVSKRKPVSSIREAIQAGQRAFGENYADEAEGKIASLNAHDIEWHFIGAIQSRKTAIIAEKFDWAHGVDRFKVARRLSDQRPEHLSPLNICLQVNLDNEPGKAGVDLSQVSELAEQCVELAGIRVCGLMAIPRPRSEFDEQRKAFAKLRQCQESLAQQFDSMTTLSIGMSGDMEAAIAEGATVVRVGTAIFGARE